MNSKVYITKKGFDNLKSEFHKLMNEERPKLVEVIAWAASNGDRSENGDYIYGKKKLREIDRRIYFLKKRFEVAEVVDPSLKKGEKTIFFGANVELENEEGENATYQIVGEDEIDIKNNKISWKSPLGRALIGKKVDDEVILKAPKGDVIYSILQISYI